MNHISGLTIKLKPYLLSGWTSAFVLMLAFLIRILGLGAESAWIDEGYSIALAKASISDIITGTAADQHPPVYYLLLHVWLILNTSVAHARLLSVLLGVLNVYQMMSFARKLGGAWTGFLAAFLLAVNPMHVWYSQEARQYMLLAVLTTASMNAFWGCVQGKNRWLAYGMLTILSLYTHYFAVFIVISQAIFTIVSWIRQRRSRIIVPWFITMLCVGVLFLPWLPVALSQFVNHRTPWIEQPESGEVRDVLLRLIMGSGVVILPEWLRWMGLAALAILFVWLMKDTVSKHLESQAAVLLLAAWCLLPYLIISFISIFYPIFQFKQFLIILIPSLLLAAFISNLFSQRWKYLVLLCLLAIPSITLIYQQVTLTKDDWRGMSVYIQTNLRSGDMVYTNPAASSLVLDLYLDPTITIRGYPPEYDISTGGWKGTTLTEEIAAQELNNITYTHARVWLVEFFPEFWDPLGYIPAWLSGHAFEEDDQWFGNAHLRLFQLNPVSP